VQYILSILAQEFATVARGINRLKPLQIDRQSKPGRYSDGGGLYLVVGKTGGKSWAFLYMRDGKRRELGLGALADVPVAEARAKAAALRAVLDKGGDPQAERDRQRVEAAPPCTFKSAAEQYIAAHKAGWRNEKHAKQWENTLTTYVYPEIGSLAVSAVDVPDVLKVLKPIWATKPETASRVRGRIEAVLDYAKAHKWRRGENPARWKGTLDHLLPARAKVQRVKHHAAMPYAKVPGFMASLAEQEGTAALALRFAILTAARTGEATGARWPEADINAAVWTVPEDRMKAGREHRVPLNAPALEILRELPRTGEYVFPGHKRGEPLSNMAMLMLLRRMEIEDATVHGFRSAFRDWAAEQTGFPREVIEAALAHANGDKVEAAYLRTDHFEKRRLLMEEWGRFCTGAVAANVVPLRAVTGAAA
jgi:integrase